MLSPWGEMPRYGHWITLAFGCCGGGEFFGWAIICELAGVFVFFGSALLATRASVFGTGTTGCG
jgi:hypothetical protein